jgi:pimeloyl-ACP methyl ester carboxylesterase
MLKRILARGAIVTLALLALTLIFSLFYRSYSQLTLESATHITTANGIESLETVELNGDTQWLYLRGHNRDNPVLLFLHGGPGMTEMPIARSFGLELEKHFTVVHWDQRGSGKSRHEAPPASGLSIDTYLQDVVALTNLLRTRFDEEKIYLVGHSWGSLLGTLAVRDHPELYHAYAGVGQIANMADNETVSLAFVREQASLDGNIKALAELAAIDPSTFGEDMSQMEVQRKWLYLYEGGVRGISMLELAWLYLASPEYTLTDLSNLLKGSTELPAALWPEVMQIDLTENANHFEIPMYFFAGGYDYNTPSELAQAYLNTLTAPRKAMIWFPESAHFMHVTASAQYQEALLDRFLPERQEE